MAVFLYFDFSFMVWTMLGPLVNEISEALEQTSGAALTDGQMATLLAIPVLAGALLRIILRFGVDKLGAKKTALIAQGIVISVLFYAYFKGATITYPELLVVALGLGFAGDSFAVALPQVRQWYPSKLQGISYLGSSVRGTSVWSSTSFFLHPKLLKSGDGKRYSLLVGPFTACIHYVPFHGKRCAGIGLQAASQEDR